MRPYLLSLSSKMSVATYTLFFILIDTLVIDLIGEGGFAGKGFLSLHYQPEEIAKKVYDDLGRGITFIRGMGYYSRKDLDIVYCVVSRNEMKQMKDIIHRSIHSPLSPFQKPMKFSAKALL